MNSSLTLIEFSAMTLLGGLLAYDHAEHKGDEQLSDSGVVRTTQATESPACNSYSPLYFLKSRGSFVLVKVVRMFRQRISVRQPTRDTRHQPVLHLARVQPSPASGRHHPLIS